MTAAAGPAIASMTGDLFDPSSRARVYGLILAGELLGTGIGFAVTGSIAAWSWRASFFVLALPALALSPMLWWMREPERATSSLGGEAGQDVEDTPDELDDRIVEAMRREGVRPRAKDVLHEDPTKMPLPRVVRYVLSIRTNLLLVIASVCGYYFFAGVSTFGITFIRDQYHVGQAQASSLTLVLGAGAIVGVLASGRLADALLERGRAAARVEVAVVALAVAVVLFVPALLADSLVVALPLLTGAALALGALNPPLDAARLDIMPPRLWGRAEGVRSMMRAGAQAAAPLAFGAMSSQLFSGGARGLQLTFLMMLVPLAGSVGIGWVARRTYLPDVAAASRSTAKLATGDEDSVRSRSGATRSSSRENASAG
jgi:MFS family permease